MPTRDVKLNIRTNPNQGFTEVAAPKGALYYYKYTGGNSGSKNGNNRFAIGEPVAFTITFTGAVGNDYEFPDPAFLNKDSLSDLTATDTPSIVTVTDTCETIGYWQYGVWVKHKASGDVFGCDPEIRHRR